MQMRRGSKTLLRRQLLLRMLWLLMRMLIRMFI